MFIYIYEKCLHHLSLYKLVTVLICTLAQMYIPWPIPGPMSFSHMVLSLSLCVDFSDYIFSCVWCNWSFMICDRKILQYGHDITWSVCFKSFHLKFLSIDHVVMEYIKQNRSTWYCSHCLINIFPFKNLENEIDFMSTVHESPIKGSLIYLSDKIVLYVEYNLRIQMRIICVCFMFVWLNSCYQCGIWSMLSTETRPGGRLNKKDGLTRYGNSHVKDKTS